MTAMGSWKRYMMTLSAAARSRTYKGDAVAMPAEASLLHSDLLPGSNKHEVGGRKPCHVWR
jgi:hypothetical protein